MSEISSVRIAGIIRESIVDGPGIRLTVFVQGCPHRCPGCHNPHTHDFEGGTLIDSHEIIDMALKNPLLKGITFSGGEPFLQAGALSFIAKELHKKGLDVITYTGYTIEEIFEEMKINKDFKSLLLETDTLIDGRFIEKEKDLSLRFTGSKNQRILDTKASYQKKEAVIKQL